MKPKNEREEWKIAQIKNTKAKAFFEESRQFIEKTQGESLFALDLEGDRTEHVKSWHYYFANHRGFIPAAFQSMIDRQTKAFTVPTEWPEWFDSSYKPPATLPAVIHHHNRLTHETLAELQSRYGPNWGLKLIEHEKRVKSSYQPLTDDQLREIYSTRKGGADNQAGKATGSEK